MLRGSIPHAPDGDRSPSELDEGIAHMREVLASTGLAREVLIPNAASVVTIGANHEAWHIPDPFRGESFKGAFVRLDPPPEVTDAVVAGVRESVERAGAKAVWARPCAKEGTVAEDAREAVLEAPGGSDRTPREVVMELAEKSACADKPALREQLEKILGQVSL
jgi:hypothetical protein